MKIKFSIKDFLWMAFGALMLLLVMLLVWHFQTGQRPVEQLAFKARRVDLVARMRLNLASASEAEKSAVLAVTDQDSKTFADQSRAATAEVERERNELGKLLAAGGTQNERDLLVQFSRVFTDFQHIDNDLLDWQSRTPISKLTVWPLARLLTHSKKWIPLFPASWQRVRLSRMPRNVALLACGAQIAALRIQTLLAPHIAEESDRKMDELEAQMTREDQEVRKDLGGLDCD